MMRHRQPSAAERGGNHALSPLIRGIARILTGQGTDTVLIGLGQPNNQARFESASSLVDGGQGTDTIQGVEGVNVLGAKTM